MSDRLDNESGQMKDNLFDSIQESQTFHLLDRRFGENLIATGRFGPYDVEIELHENEDEAFPHTILATFTPSSRFKIHTGLHKKVIIVLHFVKHTDKIAMAQRLHDHTKDTFHGWESRSLVRGSPLK